MRLRRAAGETELAAMQALATADDQDQPQLRLAVTKHRHENGARLARRHLVDRFHPLLGPLRRLLATV